VKDELKEPGLVDALQTYRDKWKWAFVNERLRRQSAKEHMITNGSEEGEEEGEEDSGSSGF
jgi:hypothetical protein